HGAALTGLVTSKERSCGSGGQSVLMIYGLIAPAPTPFEYFHLETTNWLTRKVLQGRRNRANREYGVICFSGNYTSPVQWAHYGDSHRGICLGFDVQEEDLFPIEYVKGRSSGDELKDSLDLKDRAFLRSMLSKKHKHWEYEQEHRCLVRFREKVLDDRLVFEDFADRFLLREVIMGIRCDARSKEIRSVLSNYDRDVDIFRIEVSHRDYKMVKPAHSSGKPQGADCSTDHRLNPTK
ncbi:hypothetical protein DFP85_1331, partial [Halomonas ventosae]